MKIKVPATTANLGAGYDVFGMALSFYNYLEFKPAEQQSLEIIGLGADHLSKSANNLIIRSAQAVYDICGKGKANLSFVAHNNIPLSRGMGSSSAAIVAGLMAANYALDLPLDQEQILKMAIEIEGHGDNVTPALLGGFTIIAEENGFYHKKIAISPELQAVLIIPDFMLSTKKAREIMPAQIKLSDAVYNISHAAMLGICLAENDLEGFGAMLKDRLHQPYRFSLIPNADRVIEAAYQAGALGAALSGSGSTLIAFCRKADNKAELIGQKMIEAFANADIVAAMQIVGIDNDGVMLIEQ